MMAIEGGQDPSPRISGVPSERASFGALALHFPRGDYRLLYETWILDVYGAMRLRPGDTVLDIGANVGDFALKAGRIVGDTGQVIALEPNPVYHSFLLENIRLNQLTNIVPMNVALSDRDGLVSMSPDVSGFVPILNTSEYMVRGITLDTLIGSLNRRSRLLMKMDVEGSEVIALPGQSRLSQVDEIILELHGRSAHEIVIQLLEKSGFVSERIRVSGLMRGLVLNLLTKWPWVLPIELRSRQLGLRRAAHLLLRKKVMVIDEPDGDNLSIVHASKAPEQAG